MRSVSILIPIENNCVFTNVAIQNCLLNTGILNYEIIVFNNGPNQFIKEWVSKLPNSHYIESPCFVENSVAINEMLKCVSKEYVCIIPYDVFLPQNWLLELIQWNASIPGTGITAISNSNDQLTLTTKMTEDYDNVFVYQPINNIVSGVWLFKYSLIKLIGGFETQLTSGYEYMQFCFRSGRSGFHNFYIPYFNSTLVSRPQSRCNFKTTHAEFVLNINKIVKTKNNQVKFEIASDKMNEARKGLPELIGKFTSAHKKEWYLFLSETWGFDLSGILQSEIKHIVFFCKKWNIKFMICASIEINKGISVKFFET